MVSTSSSEPIFTPARRCCACGAMLIDSCPPATTISESPFMIAWYPSATVRRPEPHSWLTPQAGLSTGMPAAMEAWRAGFCPCPAPRIWPRMTSETWAPSTPARSSAALIAILPSSCAGRLANAPLNAPTGVRAALTMTMSSCIPLLLMLGVQRPKDRKNPPLPTIGPVVPGVPHLSAGLSCILDTLPNPVVVNGSRLDLPYVHPRAIDPCQPRHGRPAGPHVTKTIAGAAETAYFDGSVVFDPASRTSGDPRRWPLQNRS